MRKISTFKAQNTGKRILSAAILIPAALFILFQGGVLYSVALVLIGLLMAYEWFSMSKNHSVLWKLFGILYILAPILSMWYIRVQADGFIIMLWMLVIIWSTDTGAFISGIVFGGPKLAPYISPSKSWSGFMGGMLLAFAAAQIFNILGLLNAKISYISLLIALVGQIGDLFESLCKRKFGVKDSGRIIPGHGGVLDRMDSVMFASVALALLLWFDMVY